MQQGVLPFRHDVPLWEMRFGTRSYSSLLIWWCSILTTNHYFLFHDCRHGEVFHRSIAEHWSSWPHYSCPSSRMLTTWWPMTMWGGVLPYRVSWRFCYTYRERRSVATSWPIPCTNGPKWGQYMSAWTTLPSGLGPHNILGLRFVCVCRYY